MARAGADLVLCQHSHCIGCREEYRGAEILYGQGNFLFLEESENPQLRCGLIVKTSLGARVQVEYIPVVVTETGIRLAAGAEKNSILSALAERSETLQVESKWLAKWESFCLDIPDYPNAVKNAFRDIPEGDYCNQVFPHYLDCEAHTDVWRVVFKSWHRSGSGGA